MASRGSKKPEGKADPGDRDALAVRVGSTLRNAGADEYGLDRAPDMAPTMRALLHQYTQYGTLTEVDEDGEHPLFPRSADAGRGEARLRTGPLRQAIGMAAPLGASGDSLRGDGPDMVNYLLRRLDNDRLPQIKDAFSRKDQGLTSDEFVSVLCGYIGHVDGADDRLVSTELARLHASLRRGVAGVAEGGSGALVLADRQPGSPSDGVECIAEGGEDGVVEPAEDGFVSWGAFAKCLLDTGVVNDIVSSFNVVKVLNHIDLDRIAPLREEFIARGNALSVDVFIVVMKRQFHYIFELVTLFELEREERQLVAQLVDLFEIVDINGHDSMSWEEFTAFLVDQGMSENAPREFDVIRFGDSLVVDETIAHQSSCEKATYFKHYDKIAFIEQGSRCVKIVTPDLMPFAELRDFAQAPLYTVYIEKEGFVAVSCSDLTISFYDANNGLKLVRRVVTKTAQLVMCWSAAAHVLYSADHEGRIFAWDIQQVKAGVGRSTYEPGQEDPCKDFLSERQSSNMRHIQTEDEALGGMSPRGKKAQRSLKDRSMTGEGGKTIVMALLELEVLGLLASCGIDRHVMLWDVFTGKLKTALKGHNKGVRCMAFAASSKVLVTGGYDYNLMVWNPYVGTSIHIMKGHTAQIVGIDIIGAMSNQVVSADSDCSVRTWDLGTYQCLQTITVGGILTLRALVSVPMHKRIICIDRKLVAYDYLNTGIADQTDESPIIKAFYISRLKVFVSGCSSHVRIWDAVTGAIKCCICHKDSEITDFCIDDRGRKIFVADHSGQIHAYNATTGCPIKKLTSHDEEVSGMIYCPGDKNIITVSWDHSIVVHDESEQTPNVWRMATNVHLGDITCLAFSRHLGLIATGATDCVIGIREYERLRTLSFLLGHKSEITALAFVDPLPLLVSADSTGNVAIWVVPTASGRNHRFANEVLTRFVNMQSLESSASVNCLDPVYTDSEPVETLQSDTFLTGTDAGTSGAGTLLLYAGDEDGDLRVWDLSRLLVVADIAPCTPKADWDPRKKDQIDSSHTTETMAQKALSPEQPELPIKINEPVVKQVRSWKAHNDSVRSAKVYTDPAFVITAGYDQMVKLWTHQGEMMTVLRAYGQIPWSFPVCADMIGIEDHALDRILEKVQEAEDRERSQVPKLAGRS